MLSTSTKIGKNKQKERNTTTSSLMEADENIPLLVNKSLNDNSKMESDIFNGIQQLSVKIVPEHGVKTIKEGSSQGLSNGGIVVKGNWIPEAKKMYVYHYDGVILNDRDNMKPEYMWSDDSNNPKKEDGLYSTLKNKLCEAKYFQKEFENEYELWDGIKETTSNQFAKLCHSKGILSFVRNSNDKLRLIFNGYHEIF